MEVNKETIEAILIMLYKLEEYEACEKLLEVYKKYFTEDDKLTQH